MNNQLLSVVILIVEILLKYKLVWMILSYWVLLTIAQEHNMKAMQKVGFILGFLDLVMEQNKNL